MEKASRSNYFHYNKKLQPLASKLRKEMTKSEACMWKYVLGSRQMLGYQFRRQRPVLDYIVDFMCMDLLLIIEIDGITHNATGAQIRDAKRDDNLQEIGFTILRFHSWQVLSQIANVSAAIVSWIEQNATEESSPD